MNHYRLAVCEDDADIRKELCTLCCSILTEDGIACEMAEFSSAQALKEVLQEKGDCFDLLILDIQMEGITGMELAKSLRQQDNRVSILFVTGCEKYLLEGYEVQPIHFLLKPVKREALAQALHTDWKLNHKPKTLLLHTGNKTVRLSLAEIRYIESFNHSIVVHQSGEDHTYLLSLSEIERQLPSGQFCRCHNSYLVNLDCVEQIGRTELRLRDAQTIPVGRTYYKALQSNFIRYLNQ